MEFSFHFADEIDPVAVYAAILSTVIFVLEIIKWLFGGEKFKGRSNSNMIVIGGYPKDDNTYVYLSLNNVGSKKTTITNVGLYSFKGVQKLRKHKPSKAAVVNHSDAGYAIPFSFEPGGEFCSRCLQTKDVVEWSNADHLYWAIFHSLSDKPILIRIAPIEVKK